MLVERAPALVGRGRASEATLVEAERVLQGKLVEAERVQRGMAVVAEWEARSQGVEARPLLVAVVEAAQVGARSEIRRAWDASPACHPELRM